MHFRNKIFDEYKLVPVILMRMREFFGVTLDLFYTYGHKKSSS
jgi:hypothetical protein